MLIRRSFIFAIVILFLGACSAGSTSNVILAPPPVDGFDKTIAIVVFSEQEKYQNLIPEVEAALASKMNLRGTFKWATVYSEPTDFILRVEILDAHKVSEASRVTLGMLAGQAKITLRAEFLASGSLDPLGILEAEGTSSGGTVFAGTNDEAIENATQEIVRWLNARN